MKQTPSYAVCAGHQATASVAADVLAAGGNAIDAAVASMWMMMLAEPCMASVGAGGFGMIHWEGKMRSLDFFCQTPITKRPQEEQDFYPITVDFGATTEDFYVGRASAATPGMVAGIFAMHERYGSVPMVELAGPTVAAARAGVVLDRFQAYDWQLLRDIFSIDPSVSDIFFRADGSLKVEGDLVQMPLLGDAVEALAREGADLFYHGEMGQRLVVDSEIDGSLTTADLAQYQTFWRQPLTFGYGDRRVYTTPSPSAGGGLIAAHLLSIADQQRQGNIDLAQVSKTVRSLADRQQDLIAFLHHHGLHLNTASQAHKWGGTSHFNVIDDGGNAVAVTVSLGEGNGYFIPGTAMQMNNMLGEGALLPAGFHSWQADQRLRSMMTPTIVTGNATSQELLVLGSGGAGRIPQMIAQVIDSRVRMGKTVEAAINYPRYYFDGRVLQLEPERALSSSDMLINQWDHQSLYFGGVHAATKTRHGYAVAPDHRRFGFGYVAQ